MSVDLDSLEHKPEHDHPKGEQSGNDRDFRLPFANACVEVSVPKENTYTQDYGHHAYAFQIFLVQLTKSSHWYTSSKSP